jgi:hypothetical protein
MMGQLAKLPAPAPKQYKDRLAFDRLVKGLLYAMHDQLHTFGARELSSVLWALAKLQQPPAAPLLRTMMDCLLAKLGGCNALDLSLVLWALATMEARPEPRWMEALLAEAAAKLHGASPQAVSNLGHALAVLEYHPGPEWLAGFEVHSLRVLPESTGQGAAGVAWCFAALKHRPGAAWASQFLELTSERLHAFEAGACARIFFSLASLDVRGARPARSTPTPRPQHHPPLPTTPPTPRARVCRLRAPEATRVSLLRAASKHVHACAPPPSPPPRPATLAASGGG